MTRKRNRSSSNKVESGGKRQKTSASNSTWVKSKNLVVKQSLLARYYPEVLSLREYLLFKLPTSSKIRRKKISSVGRRQGEKKTENQLGPFLDETLIGVSKCEEKSRDERWQNWSTFSQKAEDSVSIVNLSAVGTFSQHEIIDFAIWQLFQRPLTAQGKSQHLLCQGFRKDVTSRLVNHGDNATSNIPGVMSTYPNTHVTSLKAWPWPQVLSLMGKAGERVMIDLILDTGVFLPVKNGIATYHQLSGYPVSDLQCLQSCKTSQPDITPITNTGTKKPRLSSNINFVRNRMMYARPIMNRHGQVQFGLRHIHVMNRYTLRCSSEVDAATNAGTLKPDGSTIRIMMYIFPRQFELHNPFTADIDPRETVQTFKDYTLREEEINRQFPQDTIAKVPKRLRGMLIQLVQKLQVQHSRCAYKELLNHYCPLKQSPQFSNFEEVESQDLSVQLETQISKASTDSSISGSLSTVKPTIQKVSMMDHATPIAEVSAFCRAVLSYLIPHDFWGSGNTGKENEQVFCRNVDHFIKLRRFETLSLNEVSQGIKISKIQWLQSPGSPSTSMSQSESNKRWEIFHEFLYYLFDSLLIPLLASNFHITESNVHRYRIFYFRHDVWRTLAEPALATLKLKMFQEIKVERAHKILDSRSLGFSYVRLLPKETGIRPIMNLRRRSLKKGSKHLLGPSINSVLSPVHNVLSYEKVVNPSGLGASLFSVADMYTKLKAFKSTVAGCKQLYFAKVDVQAAFDTIPQTAILDLIASLPSEAEYRIAKHVEIKPGEHFHVNTEIKPVRKWIALARPLDDFQTFEEVVSSELTVGKKNTIFIENVVNQIRDRDELLTLLTQHIDQNMVKIGKRFYRQKEGIPQGSVLSSHLCNLFYADLEAKHLSFLDPSSTLLLRLIDDFLIITTNPKHAVQFMQIMHDGLPAYGVRVNPDKTLVNFEVTINNRKVARLVGTNAFPYCGSFIDTKTLDFSRDRERKKGMGITDSLTVEYSKVPGKTFQRRVLNVFKIQAHAMFLDTSHNSFATVRTNIYSAFMETARKMCAYIRCLPRSKRPRGSFIVDTIKSFFTFAQVLIRSKARNVKNMGFVCRIKGEEVERLGRRAFREVLGGKGGGESWGGDEIRGWFLEGG